ncbi:MAG: hypothetical protein K0S04_1257 [Herbinix sp.]|nr:hypothetical protein [Herbinix sp.]
MKKSTKKIYALVLATIFSIMSIDFSGLVAAQAAEPDTNDNRVVYYNFQDHSSTIINDASGNGKAAVMRNYDSGGFEIVDANIYGNQVKALSLPGGADGGYLEFPVGILNGLNSATISMWVNLSTDAGYQRIWDFGNNTTSYLYLLSDGGNTGFTGYATAITASGWSNEKGVSKGSNIAKNRWVLTTVVIDGTTITLYENGARIGAQDTGISLSQLGDTVNNWIGYGQFEDDPTRGMFAEVSIYNYAMTDQQVGSMFNVSDAGIVSGDYAALELGDLTAVTTDINLPVAGVNGSAISWATTCSAITLEQGIARVTRPAEGEPGATGVLTASISYGGAVLQKEFPVTVLASNSDNSIVEHDIAAISFGDLNAVVSDLTLPTRGEWGSEITWTSSAEAVIASTGTVKRPEEGSENAIVELKAIASYGKETRTKVFTVTVLAKKEKREIVAFEAIAVTTTINYSPLLPNFVKVTYKDGAQARLKTIWPVTIEASKYTQLGTFNVSGAIVGENYPIEAVVSVVGADGADAVLTASSFDLNDISLDASSILTENRERTINYLKLLDNKRMLYNFYKTFGQMDKISNVSPLGGWDEPKGLLRGHSTGHYMSALALAYASTGDQEIKKKLDEMVHELHQLQQMSSGDPAAFVTKGTNQAVWSTDPSTWGEGFISAYSPDQFALLEQYTPYATIWAPYYTLHKIMAGFLDAYEYTGNQEALDSAKALGKWVYLRLSACSQEQLTKMWDMYIAGEFGGFNESMAKLYSITGDIDYLKGAKLFDNTKFFDKLETNIDDIHGRHANQHIPQIIGAVEVYEATVKSGAPEKYYFDVAKNFWNMVVSRYAYSIGGVGRGENFKEAYQLANNIDTATNCETCAAYNLLKLTKMLNEYEPDNAEYMDYYERTLYNQIIASQNPNVSANMHNGTTYMLPIGTGTSRSYGGDYNSFTCCHGTGMENHVKYQEAAYNKTGDTLYVNLYIPTTLTWAEKGIEVVQENAYPSEHTQFTVNAIQGMSAQNINMKFRVPYWATNGFVIKVNGNVVTSEPEISTYYEVAGIKAGDVITIDMPYTYHLDKTPDKLGSSTVTSVMYGPFVMVMPDNTTNWKTLFLSDNLEDSIKKVTAETIPTVTVNGNTFKPMYDATNYSYTTYFKIVMGEDDGKPWYNITLTNRTPKFGSLAVSSEAVKEGDSVSILAVPNAGYKVKSIIVNGVSLNPTPDGRYIVANVTSNLDIVVTYVLINPPIPDPARLDQTAYPSAHYTASWEKLEGINNAAFEPTVSKGGTNKGWGNWPQQAGSYAWVMYEWDVPVAMNRFQIFWYDDGGDTARPATISFDYRDEIGSWKPVTMLSNYNDIIALDQYNTIDIQTVTGSAIRINMTIANNKAATGIYRWKVSGPTSAPEPTRVPTISPEPTQGPTVSPEPTQGPTISPEPTQEPTVSPEPTQGPTISPEPTQEPTVSPEPTQEPTVSPEPTQEPTVSPEPTQEPTISPEPTQEPTISPEPTQEPTISPEPSQEPSISPEPTQQPTISPEPTRIPTQAPTPVPPTYPIPIDNVVPTPTPTPIVIPESTGKASASLTIKTQDSKMDVLVAFNKEQLMKQLEKAVSLSEEIELPIISEKALEQAVAAKVDSLDISVKLPADVLTGERLNHTNIKLPKALLQTAKDKDIDVAVSIKNEAGKDLYSWRFDAEALSEFNRDITDINLSLSVSTLQTFSAIDNIATSPGKTSNGLVVNFSHEGILPAPASVSIYVGDLMDGVDSPIYLYYYNPVTNKLEALPYSSDYRIDSGGYIKINLIHCSDYVVLREPADQKVVTSLLDQINVAAVQKTLYLDGTKASTYQVTIAVPSTLEVVKALGDKTSGSAIGAVMISHRSGNNKIAKISESGLITAIGAGTTTITTTLKLYNNEIRVIKTKITVKKASINFKKSKTIMKVGDTFTFTVDSTGFQTKKVVWKTMKKSIIIIDQSGKATAVSKGTDYIEAWIGDTVKQIKVVVK